MLGQTKSIMLSGLQGVIVSVECDVSNGLPAFQMVGYLSAEIKEGKERVLAAFRNCGYRIGSNKITVNLTPANLHKNGTGFDLPIAIALAVSCNIINCSYLNEIIMIGEVNLTGKIQGVKGILPMILEAQKRGYRYCIVPKENEEEARLSETMNVIAVNHLSSVIQMLQLPSLEELFHVHGSRCMKEQGEEADSLQNSKDLQKQEHGIPDFKDIKGQFMLKRACEIAASGMHNLLIVGPPGVGKSLLAQALPGILPRLTMEEQLEVTSIYSICGLLQEGDKLITQRPFRSPHHKITPQGLVGGGTTIRPGEISLANHGILFLDELPEFSGQSLEALRQPMERREVTITRATGSATFPANFALVAAMNPCPCGFFPDPNRCQCSDSAIRRYQNRISGPMLDRMDMSIHATPIHYEELHHTMSAESSEDIRSRVTAVHQLQQERFYKESILFNSQMNAAMIEKYCQLSQELKDYMGGLYQKMNFSPRGYHKILKVARTIADMQGHIYIERKDLDEAILYRNWGK